MQTEPKPHPVVTVLRGLFLLSLFGGGLSVVVNLFVLFLNEGAFAIVGLVLLAQLALLFVVGTVATLDRAAATL